MNSTDRNVRMNSAAISSSSLEEPAMLKISAEVRIIPCPSKVVINRLVTAAICADAVAHEEILANKNGSADDAADDTTATAEQDVQETLKTHEKDGEPNEAVLAALTEQEPGLCTTGQRSHQKQTTVLEIKDFKMEPN